MPEAYDLNDLRNRILNLEKQDPRFKQLGAGALIGVTFLLMMGKPR